MLTTMLLLAATALLLFLIGATLFAIGLRGRHINDHPLCARCGFDLLGIPATTCPECGGDLTRPRSRRVGERRRRRAPLIAGGLLSLLGLVGGALLPWGAATSFDWIAH